MENQPKHPFLQKNRKKFVLAATAIIVVFALIILALRLLAGEDNWICQNGEWAKHGKPSSPEPTTPCGDSKTESDSYNNVQDAILASFKFID